MQEVLVKIPSTQSKKLRIERFFAGVKPRAIASDESKKVVSRTCFTHHFVIEDSSEPITINLSNIPKDVIPIEMAQTEIQKSYDKGFEEGQMSEMAVARAEINNFTSKMRTMEGVILEFEKKNNELMEQLQNSVLSIAQKVSSHIMRAESLSNFDVVKERLSKIFESIDDQMLFTIKLNPTTLYELRNTDTKIFDFDSKKVELIEDESLELGDCVILTDSGYLEAKIDDELAKLMQKLEKDFQATKIKKRDELIKKMGSGTKKENV